MASTVFPQHLSPGALANGPDHDREHPSLEVLALAYHGGVHAGRPVGLPREGGPGGLTAREAEVAGRACRRGGTTGMPVAAERQHRPPGTRGAARCTYGGRRRGLCSLGQTGRRAWTRARGLTRVPARVVHGREPWPSVGTVRLPVHRHRPRWRTPHFASLDQALAQVARQRNLAAAAQRSPGTASGTGPPARPRPGPRSGR